MVWDEEVPKINVPKEIKITEGEAFFYEVTVGSKNNLELFVHSLANAPEWVTLKQLSSIKAQFFGEAPLGSSGSYIMDYIVRGERTSISKESIIMNVKDGLSPIIKLKGKQVVRISSQETLQNQGLV